MSFKLETVYCKFSSEEEAKEHADNVLSKNIPEEDRGYMLHDVNGWCSWFRKVMWNREEEIEYED